MKVKLAAQVMLHFVSITLVFDCFFSFKLVFFSLKWLRTKMFTVVAIAYFDNLHYIKQK